MSQMNPFYVITSFLRSSWILSCMLYRYL